MSTIGIYEKALPKEITWMERLELAKDLGFHFVEMSVDETDDRLSRLDWTPAEREEVREAIRATGIRIQSMCLSGHRRFPLGSADAEVREKALVLMQKAVDLASDLGIRTIQLAGYDVYYEDKTVSSRYYFLENLKKCVAMAEEKQVVLSIEIMDDTFMSSISKFMKIKAQISSPYLQVYPDLGNLSAWPENDVVFELQQGIGHITSIHLKDTKAVTPTYPGKFKNVPFGEGCVDFDGCLKTLKQLEYNGSFVIEMWSETSDTPEAEIQVAKNYLYPKMKEAGYVEYEHNDEIVYC
jgi:hexulose-6-phosphate isomerase